MRDEESGRALLWLEEKWTGSRASPICGQPKWTVTDVYDFQASRGFVFGGPTYPVFSAVCTNCGHMLKRGSRAQR